MSEIKYMRIYEMAKEVAEKALDEYEYEGKTIRQWVEILKDYDDKQSTLREIVERLEENKLIVEIDDDHIVPESDVDEFFELEVVALSDAIEIVKEVGGMDD